MRRIPRRIIGRNQHRSNRVAAPVDQHAVLIAPLGAVVGSFVLLWHGRRGARQSCMCRRGTYMCSNRAIRMVYAYSPIESQPSWCFFYKGPCAMATRARQCRHRVASLRARVHGESTKTRCDRTMPIRETQYKRVCCPQPFRSARRLLRADVFLSRCSR